MIISWDRIWMGVLSLGVGGTIFVCSQKASVNPPEPVPEPTPVVPGPLPPAPTNPIISLDKKFAITAGYCQRVTAKTLGKTVKWTFTGPDVSTKVISKVDAKSVDFATPVKGTYKLTASVAYKDEVESDTTEIFNSGSVEPPKPPPDPDPNPKPPDPPKPPSPIPTGPLRVLIVVNDSDMTKLPKEQLNVIYSEAVDTYLKSHCLKAPDGSIESRVWDKNVDPKNENEAWKQAFATVPKDKVPWIVIGNGVTVYSDKLPTTVPEMLSVLKKLGGE